MRVSIFGLGCRRVRPATRSGSHPLTWAIKRVFDLEFGTCTDQCEYFAPDMVRLDFKGTKEFKL